MASSYFHFEDDVSWDKAADLAVVADAATREVAMVRLLDRVHTIGKYFRSVGEDGELVQSGWSETEYPNRGAPA
jgi:hypothetical protein